MLIPTYEPCTDKRKAQIRYALRMMLAQERACLSYKEARVYLHAERCESFEMLAEFFNTDVKTIREIDERAVEKVDQARQFHDVFMDYYPIYPEDRKPFDTDVSDRGLCRTATKHLQCPLPLSSLPSSVQSSSYHILPQPGNSVCPPTKTGSGVRWIVDRVYPLKIRVNIRETGPE